MPDSIKKTLSDKIWSLLEGRTGTGQLADLVLPGNRAKQTGDGWLRQAIARAPNDFPQVALAEGRFTQGGFDTPKTYGMESSGYPGAAAGWLVRDRCDFELTITGEDLVTVKIDKIAEEVRNALVEGGAHWGLSYLLQWGPISGRRREVQIAKKRRLQIVMTIPLELEFLGEAAIVRT